MRQYEFQIINKKTGRADFARATATTPAIARAQIVLAYGQQFEVMGLFCDIKPAHHILGEINCADFPLTDLAWLEREAAAIEGVQP